MAPMLGLPQTGITGGVPIKLSSGKTVISTAPQNAIQNTGETQETPTRPTIAPTPRLLNENDIQPTTIQPKTESNDEDKNEESKTLPEKSIQTVDDYSKAMHNLAGSPDKYDDLHDQYNNILYKNIASHLGIKGSQIGESRFTRSPESTIQRAINGNNPEILSKINSMTPEELSTVLRKSYVESKLMH